MLRYLVILLDADAPSFCHYPDPPKGGDRMDVETLRKAVYFAQTRDLAVDVLCSRPPGKELREELDKINHIYIGQWDLTSDSIWDITVLDTPERLANFKPNRDKNVILRLSLSQMHMLPEMLCRYSNRFLRLNVMFTDSWTMTPERAEEYRSLLESLPSLPEGVQVNIITDRATLERPNHCGAGETHLTVAPNGNFYVCPGFFADDPDHSCGSLDTGPAVPLAQLYQLDHAPLCRQCDAWQCKRCVWMNRLRTREVNTPSRGQCITAHVERNFAVPDNPTSYLDPFEIIGR